MNRIGVKIFAGLLWLSALPLAAQTGFGSRYLARELDMEQGLPCRFVDDVLVDDAGFLWIATSGGGLCRYDGYELLGFNASTEAPLRSNFVRNLAEDRFHRLWVASEGGLDVLDVHTLEKADPGLSFPEETPLCAFVCTDAEGAVWTQFGTTLYKIRFDAAGNPADILRFSHPGLREANPVFKDVDRDGSVWTCLDGGLYKIAEGSAGTLEALRIAPDLHFSPADTYVADFLLADASVWVATEEGLYRLHRSTGEWKRYRNNPADSRSLTQNFITSLALTADGLLLASTLHGLNVYNPVADNFERVGQDVINGIKVSGNRLFVATENQGLRIMEPKSLYVQNVGHQEADPASLAPGAVNAIWQEAGGRLWVGSVEGGLSIGSGGVFRHLTVEDGGLCHNSVSALRPGPDGQMFAGTWGGGIDVLSTGAVPRVLYHLPDGNGQTDYIGVLEYDALNRRLWIGSSRGIFVYDLQNGRCTPALDEAATGCIGSCIDSHGQLWIGCLEGLYVFDLAARQEDGRHPYVHYRYKLDQPGSRVEEKISCIIEASEKEMYLGSNGGGCYRAVRQADGTYSFLCYSARQGLSNDRVRGLCKDAAGRIWISTEYGLNLLNPQSGVITPFLQRDGLENVHFHWNNACAGTDGLLYFGHARGYSVLDPSALPAPAPGEKDLFRFTRVLAGDKEFRDPFLEELTLHEKDRPLLFQFAVLAPDAESGIRYRYRLEGYDDAWRRLSPGQREVAYSSLPSGKYRFRVEAFDRYGKEAGSLSARLRVKPFFRHTAGFYLLLLFAAVGLTLLAMYFRTRSLRRRQQVLEQAVERRTQELRRQNEVLLRQNEELASRKMMNGTRSEDPFKEKTLETLRALYKDPNLDVNAFCQAMGLSKTLLNKRLQEAFGQPIGQLIRTYRLTLARELLESGRDVTVAEVAYEVGFNDPKYFTRCFAKEFGRTPSEVNRA